MTKRHILMLPAFYPPMGGEFCTEQAELMASRGYHVHILANVLISLQSRPKLYFTLPLSTQHYLDRGVPVMAHYQRAIPKQYRYNVERWVAKCVRLFGEYVQQHGMPHLVHVHTAAWAACAALEIKRRYGVPYIITEHLSFDYLERETPIEQTYCREWLHRAYAESNHLIFVSENHQKQSRGWVDPTTPCSVISNTTESLFFDPRHYPTTTTPFTFICANSFWHPKGYDILIPAANLLAEQGVEFRIKIAGANFDSAAFQQLFSTSTCQERFEFLGMLSRAELIAQYKESHAMLLPSREESQSRVVLEALALGLPIVCTDVISPELINPQTGFVARNEDATDLARAMGLMVDGAHQFSPQELSNYAYSLSNADVVSQKIAQIYNQYL